MTYQLYGTPGSLYTGKARSYLIKQGIAFENRSPGQAGFHQEIIPRIGRWIIPVLEAPDGELVQDGADIIAHFEAKGATRFPAYPQTPIHKVVAHIFEFFGGEGLLRPAMHYRWNFDAHNRAFLERDFPAALAPPFAPQDMQASVFDMASVRMRKAMASFGVTEATIPSVEASYLEFLRLFDAHLVQAPYLLGGRPTIGDWGLIAPLYAHLARDPYPSALMKQTAFRVWRWTERMNAPDQDAGEYNNPEPELFADDAIPESLKDILRFIGEDYLPEVRAYVAFTNAWLAERPDLEAGTSGMERTQDRVIGRAEFVWRGHAVKVGVMPYRLYLLQKIQDAFDQAAPAARAAIMTLLADVGLDELLALRTTRRVERRNHLEVWGAPRAARG